MTVLKKPKNHPRQIHKIDLKRVQAVIDGKLDINWVSTEEIDAVRDIIYNKIAGEKQTHLGSLTVH